MYRPSLPHRKYSWYSFLLDVESTPGPHCSRKNYVNEKFQWQHRESNTRLPAFSAVPHFQCGGNWILYVIPINLMPHTTTFPLSSYCTHRYQLSQIVSSIFLCLHCLSSYLFVCLFLARQPPVGQGLLTHQVSRSHTTTHHSQ